MKRPLDFRSEQEVGAEERDARHYCGPALAELLPDGLGPAPHLRHLDAARARLAHRQLADDPLLVEQLERAAHALGRGGVPELVRHQEAPMPIVVRVRLRVDLNQDRGRLDVALLVEDPNVELKICPVGWKRSDYRFEVLGKRHARTLVRERLRLVPLRAMSTTVAQSEYELLRHSVGLVDRSNRGKLLLTGSEGAEFLQGQVTNDVEGLTPGTGCYALLLTHKGKVRTDMRVLRGEDWIMLDTEPHGLSPLARTVEMYGIGRDVGARDVSSERSILSLIGPAAREQLDVAPPDREHAFVDGEHGLYVATDLGVDVIAPADSIGGLHAALGVEPVSQETAECVRIESGRPRLGVDMDDTTIPQEAGLNERAVSFDKGCYVGQETVARLHYRGKPNRHLRGLRLSAPASTGDAVRAGDRGVGGSRDPPASLPRTGRSRWSYFAGRRSPATRCRSDPPRTRPRWSRFRSPAGPDGRIAAGPREPCSRKERAGPTQRATPDRVATIAVASLCGRRCATQDAPVSSRSVQREFDHDLVTTAATPATSNRTAWGRVPPGCLSGRAPEGEVESTPVGKDARGNVT